MSSLISFHKLKNTRDLGGMQGYITGSLGITEEEKNRLKDMYLE